MGNVPWKIHLSEDPIPAAALTGLTRLGHLLSGTWQLNTTGLLIARQEGHATRLKSWQRRL
ncbi:MAG TPA: hypothetical protein VM709_05470 [Candidatus Sulfotelmatobacter sp.]|nr:hypothetical protein [Candidatus Sulfotelmatobacter sp.]